ncbi:PAS domain-containing protein [Fundidesulfovibrio terrae]|uniref:PAS domain-containing protein n=1 Tax=Fundidesulfovibrio terrae TaxID=2922866 RepID=UPI001FAEB0BC|nr:PAS domain-containing protein [Fundidesulfovibrio terrae]
MHTHDESRKSHEELQAEVERLRREVTHLEAAQLARRRVQALLTSERDSFREAFDGSSVPQVWLDRSGRVLRLNRVAQAMLGVDIPPSDFTVFNDPQLIMLGVPPYFERALSGETVRVPAHVFNPARTHYSAPDVDLTVETVLYPLAGDVSGQATVVVQFFDVSALAAAEAEVRQLRDELSRMKAAPHDTDR